MLVTYSIDMNSFYLARPNYSHIQTKPKHNCVTLLPIVLSCCEINICKIEEIFGPLGRLTGVNHEFIFGVVLVLYGA
jgi:hypothetical protein